MASFTKGPFGCITAKIDFEITADDNAKAVRPHFHLFNERMIVEDRGYYFTNSISVFVGESAPHEQITRAIIEIQASFYEATQRVALRADVLSFPKCINALYHIGRERDVLARGRLRRRCHDCDDTGSAKIVNSIKKRCVTD
ncbi:hypothetical protein [Azospirillum thermophilum]|uniref:hypothetical protein n=1 Tax=Azospirillum thermophilum TaxID=2202148 RepID=UPI0011B7EF7E|nr:hypothetical protein [Azospirillum thermophilum]